MGKRVVHGPERMTTVREHKRRTQWGITTVRSHEREVAPLLIPVAAHDRRTKHGVVRVGFHWMKPGTEARAQRKVRELVSALKAAARGGKGGPKKERKDGQG